MNVEVVNSTISCWTDAGTKLNLGTIPGAKLYKRFPGAKVTFNGFTAMLFKTGKVNILGLRDLERVVDAVGKVTKLICSTGHDVRLKWEVKNVVTVCRLPSHIDLESVHGRLRDMEGHSMLELELYPALRIWNAQWTALMYHTGVIIVTGAKSVHASCNAVRKLYDAICA